MGKRVPGLNPNQIKNAINLAIGGGTAVGKKAVEAVFERKMTGYGVKRQRLLIISVIRNQVVDIRYFK